MAVVCELGAAVSLILGVAAPFGATLAASTMLVAGMSLTLATKKLWLASGGGEYPLVLAVLALAIGFTGPGRFSIDQWIGLDRIVGGDSQLVGIVVLAVATIASILPIRSTRNALLRMAEATAKHAGGHA